MTAFTLVAAATRVPTIRPARTAFLFAFFHHRPRTTPGKNWVTPA